MAKPECTNDNSAERLVYGSGENVYELLATWTVAGKVKVRGDSLDEAIDRLTNSETNLPKDSEYVQGSFEVDRAVAEDDYPAKEPA